jgi:formate dehydrogenase subunit gamma
VSAASDRIERWSRTERAVHWIHAAAFCTLLASGLCLYLPSAAEAVGRRPLLKSIHLWTALVWAVALAAVFVLGDRRALRRTMREVEFLDSGRLNVGQKLNTIATAAFAILFAVSGFFLWLGERDHSFRLANALLVHDYLMYVSLVLFLGHLWYAVILPSTRHSLNGMTRGWVRRDWASRHHPGWAEAAPTLPGRDPAAPPRGGGSAG